MQQRNRWLKWCQGKRVGLGGFFMAHPGVFVNPLIKPINWNCVMLGYSAQMLLEFLPEDCLVAEFKV